MKPRYSRASPSPRYRRLVEQYELMHVDGESHLGIPPEATFTGQSLPPQALRIKQLIRRTAARTILDYGCGKGQQYWPRRMVDEDDGTDHPDIKSYWGVSEIRCYDPAYRPFSQLPQGRFDGVVCTDVLEHCPEDDLPWILDELFAYATRFLYANVACFPARKRLPSGGNAHCTIKPARWWNEMIACAAQKKPEVVYEFRLAYVKANQLKETTLASPATA